MKRRNYLQRDLREKYSGSDYVVMSHAFRVRKLTQKEIEEFRAHVEMVLCGAQRKQVRL